MISLFHQVFRSTKVVLPVIHVDDEGQALRNARNASDCGADGIFLSNHDLPWIELLEIHQTVQDHYPDWWIGVNCLDLSPEEVFGKMAVSVAGVWTDNAKILENMDEQPFAEKIMEVKRKSGWKSLYFGGVAFKYQRHVTKLRDAAMIATRYMDVITTSGPATGKPAPIEKIRIMKEAIGDFPVAIASGITPENVTDYLLYAYCLLVATGISLNFIELEEKLLLEVVRKVRQ